MAKKKKKKVAKKKKRVIHGVAIKGVKAGKEVLRLTVSGASSRSVRPRVAAAKAVVRMWKGVRVIDDGKTLLVVATTPSALTRAAAGIRSATRGITVKRIKAG